MRCWELSLPNPFGIWALGKKKHNLKHMSYGLWFSVCLIDYAHSSVSFLNLIFAKLENSILHLQLLHCVSTSSCSIAQ